MKKPEYMRRIPDATATQLEMIRNCSTEELRTTLRHLENILILSDEMWSIWYAIHDEIEAREG